MPDLKIGLTNEELSHLRKYTLLISGSKGRIDLLTEAEQLELSNLLKKSMSAQETVEENEIK